jgi:hypothetical protein
MRRHHWVTASLLLAVVAVFVYGSFAPKVYGSDKYCVEPKKCCESFSKQK